MPKKTPAAPAAPASFSCDTAALKQALALAAKAVSRRSTLAVLSNVLLRVQGSLLYIASTDLAYALRIAVPVVDADGELAITLPAAMLSQIVAGMAGRTVTVEIASRTWRAKLQSGGQTATLAGIDPAEFPEWTTGDWADAALTAAPMATFDLAQLRRVQSEVAFAALTDDSRPVLASVETAFDAVEQRVHLAATDGYRLATLSLPAEIADAPDAPLIIPAGFFALVSDATSLHAAQPGAQVALYRSVSEQDVRGLYLRSAADGSPLAEVVVWTSTIDARFPDYKAIIPARSTTCAEVDAAELKQALRAARFFGSQAHLNFAGPNRLIVSASGDLGDTQIELEMELSGPPLEIVVNPAYMVESVSTVGPGEPTVVISATNAARPLTVTRPAEPSSLQVIMPMHKNR